MIINRNFKNNEKFEKTAALLALHAEKGGEHGRCLLSEEMAALVDAKCGKEELAIFMQHLSSCEKCYQEWLTLKKMDDSKSSERRVYRLRRIKKYSFIGSALAVAASVAIFLNISHLPTNFKDKPFQEAAHEQPGSATAVPQRKMETKALDVEKEREQAAPAAPVALDSMPKQRLENRELPLDKREALKQSLKGFSGATNKSVPQPIKKAAPAAITSDEYTSMDVDSWLEQIQKNCLSGRQDTDFWSKTNLQGKKILSKTAGSLPRDKEEKVSAVLTLLDKIGSESVADQCRQLLVDTCRRQKEQVKSICIKTIMAG